MPWALWLRVDFRGQMPPRGREAGSAMAPALTATYELLDRFHVGESWYTGLWTPLELESLTS